MSYIIHNFWCGFTFCFFSTLTFLSIMYIESLFKDYTGDLEKDATTFKIEEYLSNKAATTEDVHVRKHKNKHKKKH